MGVGEGIGQAVKGFVKKKIEARKDAKKTGGGLVPDRMAKGHEKKRDMPAHSKAAMKKMHGKDKGCA